MQDYFIQNIINKARFDKSSYCNILSLIEQNLCDLLLSIHFANYIWSDLILIYLALLSIFASLSVCILNSSSKFLMYFLALMLLEFSLIEVNKVLTTSSHSITSFLSGTSSHLHLTCKAVKHPLHRTSLWSLQKYFLGLFQESFSQ